MGMSTVSELAGCGTNWLRAEQTKLNPDSEAGLTDSCHSQPQFHPEESDFKLLSAALVSLF